MTMRSDDEILSVSQGHDVPAAAARLYGEEPTAEGIRLRGVVHVTAVWEAGQGGLTTLAIGEGTPQCHHDAFALNWVRASADAIITTGKILRSEPHLQHRLGGPGELPQALTEYRRSVLGKEDPPVTLVLTSGRDLDLEHGVFHAWTRPLIYTSLDGQWLLESRAADFGVEVAGAAQPTIQGAVELLQREFGAATIALEAGPSVSRQLYDPLAIDHLLMSTLQAPRLAASAAGAPFLDEVEVHGLLGKPRQGDPVQTLDGSWTFRHFRR